MQLVFTSVGAVMGAIGLMILFVGILATGATRQKVYHAWRARVGGRISCAVVSTMNDNYFFFRNINPFRKSITEKKRLNTYSDRVCDFINLGLDFVEIEFPLLIFCEAK